MSEKDKEEIRQAVADYMRSELPEDVRSRIEKAAEQLIESHYANDTMFTDILKANIIEVVVDEWRLGQQDSLKQLNEIHCLKVENHQLEFGLMKIELAQKAELLKSCESALEDRDKEIVDLKEEIEAKDKEIQKLKEEKENLPSWSDLEKFKAEVERLTKENGELREALKAAKPFVMVSMDLTKDTFNESDLVISINQLLNSGTESRKG